MKFLVKEIKSKEGHVHFRRYRLLELPIFRIYLHQILKADEDGVEHDHPWDFLSIILKGGYVEQKNKKLIARLPGSIGICTRPFHHLLYEIFSPTWTLVFAWGKRTNWGYFTDQGWKDHITFRREKHWRKFNEKRTSN